MEDKNLSNKCTVIDGAATTQYVDSTGESLDVKNLDISSLLKGTGVINYEHSSKSPSDILGKIIFAKKLFSVDDCSNEREVYWWNKVNAPMLYIQAELFDGTGHQQASELASIMRYDQLQREKGIQVPNVISFSVEGSVLNKVPENGIKSITDSIARAVTCTIKPANHTAAAEIMPKEQKSMEADPLAFLDVELGKSEKETIKTYSQIPYIALTKSMKPVLEYLPADHYVDFNSQDHLDAADAHFEIAAHSEGSEYQYHLKKSEEHLEKSTALERYLQSKGKSKHEQRAVRKQGEPKGVFPQSKHFPNKKGQSSVGDVVKRNVVHTQSDSFTPVSRQESIERAKGMHRSKLSEIKSMPKPDLGKALAAGMGSGSPATAVGGTALSKEHLKKKISKVASKVKNFDKLSDYLSKKHGLEKHEGVALAKMLIARKIKSKA